MVVVIRDIWRAYTLTHGATMVSNLFLHVPVPLVYLALLEAETLLKFDDLCLGPARILLEFEKQDFILLLILS